MTEPPQTPDDPDAPTGARAGGVPSAADADQPAPVTEIAPPPVPPVPEPPTAVTPPPPAATPSPPPRAPSEPLTAGPPTGAPGSPPPPPSEPPRPEFGPAGAGSAAASERPEIPIAAAFAGGFVLAMILKRLAK